MSITEDRPSDLQVLETDVLEHLEDDAGHLGADLDDSAEAAPDEELAPLSLRAAVAIAFPLVAAGVMVGGIFTGVGARGYAIAAALAGLGLAVVLSRVRKGWVVMSVATVGLFAIGAVLVMTEGIEAAARLQLEVRDATADAANQRPPVPLSVGWQAILGWIMGFVGFGVGWVSAVLRRHTLALVLPLPLAGIAGISVPDNAQVASGLAVLVLFLVGLGLLSSARAEDETDGDAVPLAYEVRRAAKSLPLIAGITVVMALLSQSDFLFPETLIDPAQEPQKPKTTPLSEVEDRVLFEVDAEISGPWRVGSLDIYDGQDWRLPPFAENELDEVPSDGVVDRELTPAVRADFTIRGLSGSVLPGLPNPVGIVAEGPRLAYDPRTGNIRVDQGSIEPGQRYTVAAAGVPSVSELRAVNQPLPPGLDAFLDIPDPPPAVRALLDEAAQFDNTWDRFDFLRTHVLDTVVATGIGEPVSITPARVQEILGSADPEGSPFEIVALQAMLARWAGVPARIGYGFDGGEAVEGLLQIRPKHGASFVEVYFPGYKWLPVLGTPKQAEPTVGGDPSQQQTDPDILPSEEASVQLFVPEVTPAPSLTSANVLRTVGVLVLFALVIGAAYTVWPALHKARIRSKRRVQARRRGPRDRIALAYAEWRDHATDFGFSHPSDTPIAFLDRMVDDEEHTELAWVTTRALWGDLQDEVDDDMATLCEELSRNLRQRLSQAQPGTVRAVAALSRLSLRDPFAPRLAEELGQRAPRRQRVLTRS